jgi:hypothetical protein
MAGSASGNGEIQHLSRKNERRHYPHQWHLFFTQLFAGHFDRSGYSARGQGAGCANRGDI